MSNCCDYHARLRGTRQGVTDLLWWLFDCGPLIYKNHKREWVNEKNRWEIVETKGQYCPGYVGRIGHRDTDIIVMKDTDDDMMIEIVDWCAWSFQTSGCDNGDELDSPEQKSIPFLCKVYDVKFEVFSREDGEGFSEYFYFDGKNEDGDDEDYFDHDKVGYAMEKDGWHEAPEKADYSYWKWEKLLNGKRKKIYASHGSEIWNKYYHKLWSEEYRVLCEFEWDKQPICTMRPDEFLSKTTNSWKISYEAYRKMQPEN